MRKRLTVLTLAVLAVLVVAAPAKAGSPHFIDSAFSATRSGDTVTVSAKEAGLGDESQIVVTVSGTAACLNPGDNFPQAGNKQAFSTTVTVPVQNGKADYSVPLNFAVQPKCNPPMALVIGELTVFDATNNLTHVFSEVL
jgi:hypothetical protein